MARKTARTAPPPPPRPGERPVARWRPAAAWVLGTVGVLAALLVCVLSLAQLLGGEVLREPLARMASAWLGRPVAVEKLRFNLLTLQPGARVDGLVVGNVPLAGMPSPTGPMLSVSSAEVSLRAPALLRGAVVLPTLLVDGPDIRLARNAAGEANWDLGGDGTGGLPMVERVRVTGGRFVFDDRKKGLRLEGRFGMEDRGGNGRGSVFVAGGRGTANGAPVRFSLTGGALAETDDGKPYPLQVRVSADGSSLVASGTLREPPNPTSFAGTLQVRGQDLSDLYGVTGIALPNTPPYALSMRLEGRGREFLIQGLTGRLGDSDIGGTARIDLRRARLFVEADLRTRALDFDDLLALLGAPPATGGKEAASPRQLAEAARLRAEARLFPDAKLKVRRLRAMDAAVRYRADKVAMAGAPLSSMDMTVALKDGVLTLDPLRLGLAGGTVRGSVRLDARGDVPAVAVDVRARGLEMAQFFATAQPGQRPALDGTLLARVQVEGRGFSVRETAATADGRVTVVIPSGRMRRAFAELMGINLANGLGLLLADDESETVLRCGVGDFSATDGQLAAHTLVLDTGPVIATGKGGINLGTERLDLLLQGHPKDPRVLRLYAPVAITGPMRSPQVSVDVAGGAAQAGTALVLGALLTPVAAVLPFIDPGLADDANCRALVSDALRRIPSPTAR